MDTIRTFFAITLPDDVKHALKKVIKQLKKNLGAHSARFIEPDNLHLTLRFLGEAPLDVVDHLKHEVHHALGGMKPFSLTPGRIMLFPSVEHPHVIILGIQPEQALYDLVATLESLAQEAGFRAEKTPFIPHISLVRLKHPCREAALEGVTQPIDSITVQSFQLFKSEPTELGSHYTRIEDWRF